MPAKRKTEPTEQAYELLDQLGLKRPPVPVEKIAKNLGAVVRYSPLDDEISGMIYIKKGTPIIGVNSLHHPNRQRFTIAHELGHLVLHRDKIEGTVHVDKVFAVLMRDVDAAAGMDAIEIEANCFAAALLMPEVLLRSSLRSRVLDIDDEKPLVELAQKFRVSRQAMEFRLGNLVNAHH